MTVSTSYGWPYVCDERARDPEGLGLGHMYRHERAYKCPRYPQHSPPAREYTHMTRKKDDDRSKIDKNI